MISMFFLRFLFLFFSFCAVGHAAVILQYHRFGDDRYPSTNVTMEQFRSHLDYLRDNNFQVVPLADLIERVRSGDEADGIVALTVDDAFLSVHENALPLLVEYNYPMTLFIVPDSHGGGGRDYMDWSQLREAVDSGLVSIGSQTLSHRHLPLLDSVELEEELRGSREEISRHLGVDVLFLAYPYGEASLEVMAAAKSAGYVAAFGQHSGAVGVGDNLFYLPRFSVNEAYGDLGSLSVKIRSLAFGVYDFVPIDPIVGDDLVEVRFRSVDGFLGMSCFHSDFGLVVGDVDGDEYVLRFSNVFSYGRSRLNCTMRIEGGRFRWFGWQFVRYGAYF